MEYNPPVFGYIGSKNNLLYFIEHAIEDYTKKKLSQIKSISDPFSGSGAVTFMFLKNNIPVVHSNDMLYCSQLMSSSFDKASITKERIIKIINELNMISRSCHASQNSIPSTQFVLNQYTEHGPDKRLYFTPQNGAAIDAIRQRIEELYSKTIITSTEYQFLLKLFIQAVVKVSNITCVYGAFLKEIKKNAAQPLQLSTHLEAYLIDTQSIHTCFNEDIYNVYNHHHTLDEYEVIYIDPPYSGRRYDTSYHVLETIAKYDNPKLNGKTGLRDRPDRSPFTQKATALRDFERLFQIINRKCKYLFMSYSSDANIPQSDLHKLIEKYFTEVKVYEKTHKRVKTNDTNAPLHVTEYIFAAQTPQPSSPPKPAPSKPTIPAPLSSSIPSSIPSSTPSSTPSFPAPQYITHYHHHNYDLNMLVTITQELNKSMCLLNEILTTLQLKQ